jgi:hydroxyacyl-ACP dehydratase HTD2-like protein with hotdog domain
MFVVLCTSFPPFDLMILLILFGSETTTFLLLTDISITKRKLTRNRGLALSERQVILYNQASMFKVGRQVPKKLPRRTKRFLK